MPLRGVVGGDHAAERGSGVWELRVAAESANAAKGGTTVA